MRYFLKYLDLQETSYLRNQSHPRTIGRYEDKSPITSDLGSVIRRYMGISSVPMDLAGNLKDVTIIGVLKTNNDNWIISREFKPDWIRKYVKSHHGSGPEQTPNRPQTDPKSTIQ